MYVISFTSKSGSAGWQVQTVAANPDGTPTFPLDLGAAVFVRAAVVSIVTGLLAGIVPARRASRLDPAVVIRHG